MYVVCCIVVDSVDIERMKEAEMELMRTARFPDNQGVHVSTLANKQNLPGARNPKVLQNLLGLCWLQQRYKWCENIWQKYNFNFPAQ
ncbi:unnamed protein product [Ceratitis capitata]|uniref:(Mediterranean fruit fly) hypothetical protein n=1 Tax=Ceratitis capitata TaxID=7213 RepID=A0A811UTR5_CERCA|nr:unnamed protein product [Ceratitis capitata]